MSKGKNNQRVTREDRIENSFRPSPPLVPKNQSQAELIECLNQSPYTLITGHPGTGKTYIPTRLASLWYKQNAISQIILVRPAASASQSLGFFKGDHIEKMKQWLRPILSTLSEEFSPGQLKYMMSEEVGALQFVPLETAKGNSWKDAFVIVDEAEDCNLKEMITLMSRLGTNSTMAICGDINQVDISSSGLGEMLALRDKSETLVKCVDHISFDDYDDIVRSLAVKNFIIGLDETN